MHGMPNPSAASAAGSGLYATPGPMAPTNGPGLGGTGEEDEFRTVGIRGANIGIKLPKQKHYLQLLDKSGQWCDLMAIDAGGKKVNHGGRMVMRLGYADTQLRVEDPGTLNGLYLRITQPVEIFDGLRFRIGDQVIEFRTADPFEPAELLQTDDGEEFLSRDLEPLAFLDLIRPNGRPGISFPITKPDLTVIGREKRTEVNIALAGDPLVSGRHAGIVQRDGKFYLEDLKSTNGTYVKVQEATPLKTGDEILAGHFLFRIADESRR